MSQEPGGPWCCWGSHAARAGLPGSEPVQDMISAPHCLLPPVPETTILLCFYVFDKQIPLFLLQILSLCLLIMTMLFFSVYIDLLKDLASKDWLRSFCPFSLWWLLGLLHSLLISVIGLFSKAVIKRLWFTIVDIIIYNGLKDIISDHMHSFTNTL